MESWAATRLTAFLCVLCVLCGLFIKVVRDYFMISIAFDLPKTSTAAIASDGFFVCPQIGASSICSQTKKPPSYR